MPCDSGNAAAATRKRLLKSRSSYDHFPVPSRCSRIVMSVMSRGRVANLLSIPTPTANNSIAIWSQQTHDLSHPLPIGLLAINTLRMDRYVLSSIGRMLPLGI